LLVSGDDSIRFQGDFIQVFYRLRHHLDPNVFHPAAYAGYAALLVVWLTLLALGWFNARGRPDSRADGFWRHWRPTDEQRWFHRFVAATCAIALCGLIVGLGPPPSARSPYQSFRMTVLKLYPFRLFDAVLPLAVCCQVAVLAELRLKGRFKACDTPGSGNLRSDEIPAREVRAQPSGQSGSPGQGRPSPDQPSKPVSRASRVAPIGFVTVYLLALALPSADRNPSRLSPAQLNDWLDACRWVREHTSPDALILTPPTAWAFKWYAERAEYVNFKDCPQDAAGIVEWNRRLRYLKQWGQKNYSDGGYSAEEVRELRRKLAAEKVA